MAEAQMVEVIYALPDKQFHQQVVLKEGDTVEQIIQRSQLLQHYPELTLPLTVGIWGKRVEMQHKVAAGDRVEIYRPLLIDPKQARKAIAPKMPRRKN